MQLLYGPISKELGGTKKQQGLVNCIYKPIRACTKKAHQTMKIKNSYKNRKEVYFQNIL